MSVSETILLIAGIYMVLSLIAYNVQEIFLFKPEKLPPDFKFDYQIAFEELFFHIKPGVSINGLHFKATQAKGVVLYYHGNTKSIKGWGKFAGDFVRYGYDVVMVDYRGFGKSTGRRSERGLKNDAQFIYNELKQKFPEENIVVYGRSLGSGFAAKLASMNQPKMLILDAPYFSLSKTAQRYLPFLPVAFLLRYPIRTYLWLRYVKCPIKIIHGTRDKLIPFRVGVRLAEIAPDKTRLFPIIGGGHNNLHTYPAYHFYLQAILDGKI